MSLTNDEIRTQQRSLAALTLYHGRIDGIDGPKTQTARNEFAEFEGLSEQDNFTIRAKEKVFSLPVTEYEMPDDLAETVKKVCQSLYRNDIRIWSYIMATVQHETNNSYYPVPEAYFLPTEQARQKYLRKRPYYPYYGRGLVQLTWEYNYKKYSEILELPLVEEPDIALEPAISLFILIHGMLTGGYTGRSLERYITSTHCDYINARRVVNGTDKAALIAGYAKQWESRYAESA